MQTHTTTYTKCLQVSLLIVMQIDFFLCPCYMLRVMLIDNSYAHVMCLSAEWAFNQETKSNWEVKKERKKLIT